MQQMRALHGRCLRNMCRVTRAHTWKHHISSVELMQRLGLDAADFYVARRQLGWAGHVARMDYIRLPQRMLSSWVPHKRPRGAPSLTYGRTLAKALDVFDIDQATSGRRLLLTAPRGAQRCMQSGQPPPAFRARPSTPAALPLAYTRARRSTTAATKATIDRCVLSNITNTL